MSRWEQMYRKCLIEASKSWDCNWNRRVSTENINRNFEWSSTTAASSKTYEKYIWIIINYSVLVIFVKSWMINSRVKEIKLDIEACNEKELIIIVSKQLQNCRDFAFFGFEQWSANKILIPFTVQHFLGNQTP